MKGKDERFKYLEAKEATREYLLGFISREQYMREVLDLPQETAIELPTIVRREAIQLANAAQQ